eukprot:COSAG02_NODE_4022_length_5891_cov_111.561119_3_plen_212_part_00
MLELGAGLSLPSIVAAKFGHPRLVVSRCADHTLLRSLPLSQVSLQRTSSRPVSYLGLALIAFVLLDAGCHSDYPDNFQLDNIRHNAAENLDEEQLEKFHVVGHEWGSPVAPLLELTRTTGEQAHGFDLVVMADLIYKGSLHTELLQSASNSLGLDKQARILISWDKNNQPLEVPRGFLKMAELAPHYLFEEPSARLEIGDVTMVALERRRP